MGATQRSKQDMVNENKIRTAEVKRNRSERDLDQLKQPSVWDRIQKVEPL